MNEPQRIVTFLALMTVCLLAGSGCAPTGSLYLHRSDKPPAAALSDPRTWKLSGSLRDIRQAVDGNCSTAAVSNPIYENAAVTIDLRKACLFNALFIHHGSMPEGYCRRVAVLTSLDGRNFTPQFEAPGTRAVTSVCIIRPILARFIRIQAVKQGLKAWSVAELYVQ